MKKNSVLATIALAHLTVLSAAAGVIYDVSLNTSGLISHAAGPFSLNIQLNDGEGTGDGNNTASLTSFFFDAGGPTGTATLVGGATGDLGGSVLLNDTGFLNSFTQAFSPGGWLSFRLLLTTNLDPGGTPDQFSLSILDSTGFEIPTEGLSIVGSDVLLLADISSSYPTLLRFGSDPSRSPFGGGDPISFAAPELNQVPEPGTWLLMMTGLTVVGCRRLRGAISKPRRLSESRPWWPATGIPPR